eukprot:SAG11_NODE_367_length_10114_cov_16.930904_6_plen_79_part_00
MMLLVYCAFAIPIRVSFDFQVSNGFKIWELAVDMFFIVDIFVNFRMGYIEGMPTCFWSCFVLLVPLLLLFSTTQCLTC